MPAPGPALLGPAALDQVAQVVRIVLGEQQKLDTRKNNARNPDEWSSLMLGKTTIAHDKGETELVDLYGKYGDTLGSETKLTLGNGDDREVEVYNRFADIEADKWVIIVDLGSGLELIAAEC